MPVLKELLVLRTEKVISKQAYPQPPCSLGKGRSALTIQMQEAGRQETPRADLQPTLGNFWIPNESAVALSRFAI